MKLATITRNAIVDGVKALLDAGAAGGTIKIYSGSPPANPQASPSGTLLATLTFSVTSFPAAVAGTATANAITEDSSVDNSGTAGWARLADSNGATVMDLTVGTSGTDLVFDSVTFLAGGVCQISALQITCPES